MALGYVLGTAPSADVAARVATAGRVDLRDAGSRNPGAANAAAILGSGWGSAVLAADIVKAAVACRLGGGLAGSAGANLAGSAAVVGHCFPVWNGFRGGKGVGCTVGQCLATFPAYFPLDLAVAGATATGPWRRRAFVATVSASTAWVAAAALWWRRRLPNAWGPAPDGWLPVAAAISSGVVAQRFVAAARR